MMSEPVHYPSPDFDCPAANSFSLPPRSTFHASMWSWTDSPTETSWGSNRTSANWYQGTVASQAAQNSGRGWHQTGPRGGWHNSSPQGNYWKSSQNKKESECPFFCDTCDRGFKTHDKYDEHMAQHVKCSVPDCSFTAHEKIVSIHWKNNHAPGKKRIKLDTPEEIAKWREERRRNYPTVNNIEKKQKIKTQQEATGAVLETAQFGRMRGRGRGRRWFRGNRGRYNQGMSDRDPAERPPPLTRPGAESDPLGALASNDHDSDKDEPSVVLPPKQTSSALASLVASYGSASESDEEPGALPLQRAMEVVQENQDMLNTIRPQHTDLKSTETSSNMTCHSYQTNQRGGRGRGGRGGRMGRGGGRRQDTPQQRRPTLLEMLLATDIRHERNVLLQCVRFVVRNNFFMHESGPQNGESISEQPSDRSSSQRSSLVSRERTTVGSTNVSTHCWDQSENVCPSKAHTTEALISSTEENSDPETNLSSASAHVYDDEIWENHVVTG